MMAHSNYQHQPRGANHPLNNRSNNLIPTNPNQASNNSSSNSSLLLNSSNPGAASSLGANLPDSVIGSGSSGNLSNLTPTSVMFQNNGSSSNFGGNGSNASQLSPNRGVMSGQLSVGPNNSRVNSSNSNNIFGNQRAFNPLQNSRSSLMPNNNSNMFMQNRGADRLFGLGGGGASGMQSYQSVFGGIGGDGGGGGVGGGLNCNSSSGLSGGGGCGLGHRPSSSNNSDITTPPLLDLTEFPSLTTTGHSDCDGTGGAAISNPSSSSGMLSGRHHHQQQQSQHSHHHHPNPHHHTFSQSFSNSLLFPLQQQHPQNNPTIMQMGNRNATTTVAGVSGGGGSGSVVAGKAYVGMVKQPTSEQSEFQMSNEDFPALPGTQHMSVSGGGGGGGLGAGVAVGGNHHQSSEGGGGGGGNAPGSGGGQSTVSGLLSSSNNNNNTAGMDNNNGSNGGNNAAAGTTNSVSNGSGGGASSIMGMELHSEMGGNNNNSGQQQQQAQLMKRGVQTSPDGKVTNIPLTMVNNQFGMIGLLTFIRESDPNLVSLAMGQDLTTLGLNLNSSENLHPCFGGPFVEQPCRPQDIDFHVPPEYLVNMSIADKLAPIQLKKYKDDLLFFLFYTNVGDVMQLAAAQELHNRDWRYHIEEKVWITRAHSNNMYEKNGATERGTFYIFDAQNWRRVMKDFLIDTTKLDKCPSLNTMAAMAMGQPV